MRVPPEEKWHKFRKLFFHPYNDPASMLAVCMTLKPIWKNSNRNAFGVNDEENKMPRIVIRDRRIPTHKWS